MKATKAAIQLADKISKLEGVTLQVLRMAMYRVKVHAHICVHDSCTKPAMEGCTRCEKHRASVNRVSRNYYERAHRTDDTVG